VAERLSGWKEDDCRGLPIEQVLILRREEDSEIIENPAKHALRVGGVVGLENHTELVSRNGTVMTVDDSASPIRDADGTVVGAVLVFRDVTQRRREQRELTEAQALTQSVVEELRRSNDDLSQFAAVASHDLRSPLNNVMQFAQLIDRRYSDELGDGREMLGMLITSAKRMGSLIEDLLRYASISSEISPTLEPTDSNSQLEAALQNLDSSIKETRASITSDSLPSVHVDETHLTQIFQNLIGNAIHYRSSGIPKIHIGVEARGKMWRFSCADNGIGIAEEYQAQIFEPFKRLHGHDRPGTGIGLAICRKIIERFGGRIWVESEVGKGSTFFFTLPSKLQQP